MNFELGKEYIVRVTEKGIIPIDEFDRARFFDKDCDSLDFLTDEEKAEVINKVLDEVKAETEKHQFSREYCCDHNIDTAIDMGMVRIILDNLGKTRCVFDQKDNKGDSVSRQAINGYIDYILSHGMGKKKSFDFIKKFVANLPSVTPQDLGCSLGEKPKENKGKWEDGNNICPKCGEDKYKGLEADIYADWQPNFCPNCGANMKGE